MNDNTESVLTEDELAYLRSQRLCRLATVSSTGQPDVAPVGFEFDGTHFYIGGRNPVRTRRFLSVKNGNDKVALVVDDLESVTPWRPRGIRIYGRAEIVEHVGRFGPGYYMRITPDTSWSWGLEPDTTSEGGFKPRKTVWPK